MIKLEHFNKQRQSAVKLEFCDATIAMIEQRPKKQQKIYPRPLFSDVGGGGGGNGGLKLGGEGPPCESRMFPNGSIPAPPKKNQQLTSRPSLSDALLEQATTTPSPSSPPLLSRPSLSQALREHTATTATTSHSHSPTPPPFTNLSPQARQQQIPNTPKTSPSMCYPILPFASSTSLAQKQIFAPLSSDKNNRAEKRAIRQARNEAAHQVTSGTTQEEVKVKSEDANSVTKVGGNFEKFGGDFNLEEFMQKFADQLKDPFSAVVYMAACHDGKQTIKVPRVFRSPPNVAGTFGKSGYGLAFESIGLGHTPSQIRHGKWHEFTVMNDQKFHQFQTQIKPHLPSLPSNFKEIALSNGNSPRKSTSPTAKRKFKSSVATSAGSQIVNPSSSNHAVLPFILPGPFKPRLFPKNLLSQSSHVFKQNPSFLMKKKMEKWSENEVVSFVLSLRFEEYAARFLHCRVNGALLKSISDSELRNEIGIKNCLHRKRLLIEIDHLRKTNK